MVVLLEVNKAVCKKKILQVYTCSIQLGNLRTTGSCKVPCIYFGSLPTGLLKVFQLSTS